MVEKLRSLRIFSSVVVMAFIFSPAQSSLCWKSVEPLRQHFPTTSFAEQMLLSSEPSVEIINFVDPKDSPAKPVIGGDCTKIGKGYGPNSAIIHVTTTKSWMACQRACEEYEGCAFFNVFLSAKIGNCALYGSTAQYLNADGVLSGPKRCGNPYSCFQEGIQMHGNDIVDYPDITSSDQCKTKCLQHPECEYFYTAERCWLKTKAALANVNASSFPGAVIGTKSCHPQWCFLNDISLNTTGANVVTTLRNIDSATSCQLKCQQNAECVLWTYKANRDCFLLKSDYTQQASLDAISGWKFCGNPRSKSVDLNFLGPDIATLRNVPVVDKCIENCYKNTGCHFYTYNKDHRICYLHPREAALRSGSCSSCVRGAVIPGVGQKLRS